MAACVDTRPGDDANTLFRIIASRKPLSYLVIAMSSFQWSSVQRMVAFARDMTAHGPIRPGLVVVSQHRCHRQRPLLICEVVGRLILIALQRGFKLRTFT